MKIIKKPTAEDKQEYMQYQNIGDKELVAFRLEYLDDFIEGVLFGDDQMMAPSIDFPIYWGGDSDGRNLPGDKQRKTSVDDLYLDLSVFSENDTVLCFSLRETIEKLKMGCSVEIRQMMSDHLLKLSEMIKPVEKEVGRD